MARTPAQSSRDRIPLHPFLRSRVAHPHIWNLESRAADEAANDDLFVYLLKPSPFLLSSSLKQQTWFFWTSFPETSSWGAGSHSTGTDRATSTILHTPSLICFTKIIKPSSMRNFNLSPCLLSCESIQIYTQAYFLPTTPTCVYSRKILSPLHFSPSSHLPGFTNPLSLYSVLPPMLLFYIYK